MFVSILTFMKFSSQENVTLTTHKKKQPVSWGVLYRDDWMLARIRIFLHFLLGSQSEC